MDSAGWSPADLKRFFAPETVALVGASDDLSRFGGRALHRMKMFGFRGEVYPVNPRLKEVQGLPCYASIRDVPQAPDHVGVVVPATMVLSILEDCVERGCRFATVFSGGFAEVGTPEGRALQQEITAFSRASGLRVMGPNCNGLVNFVDNFAFTSSSTVVGMKPLAGRVGIVSQSGGVGQVNVMWRARDYGVGISYEVSCGNSADLDVIDFLEFMIDDPHTDVVTMIVEEVPGGSRFLKAARRAAELRKPIVILKVGRTEAGALVAASHTGAVTGSDRVHDAVFAQFGVIRVDDTNELYEMAMMLSGDRPRGSRLAATTVSGGNGVLAVDLGSQIGLSWPSLGPATQDKLASILPALASSGNPTDLTNAAIGKPDVFQRTIGVIAEDESIDAVVAIFTMSARSDVEQGIAAARASEKPIALLWTGGCTDDPSFTPRDVAEAGVPVFRNTYGCMKAIRAAVGYEDYLAHCCETEKARRERPAGMDTAVARAIVASAAGPLTERESKQVLSAYGLPVTREMLARSAEEAVEYAASLGVAVALKIESPDIPHKTEANGIRLRLVGESAVREAFESIMDSARRYNPEAELRGVLVQEMVDQHGLELILGCKVDPTFGPVAAVGLGGIHAEVLDDIALRLAPVGRGESLGMLRELRAYPLLNGVRGQRPSDLETLSDIIVRVSWLAHDLADLIRELDVNPLLVSPNGDLTRVVDALIVPWSTGSA
jgi:acyl-CoA synthetase (NDP forming)